MSDRSIFRTKRTSNFTTVCNDWIYNPALSAKAKGVLLYLLSKPDDWETVLDDIVAHMLDGVDAIKSAIKELKKAGHMVKRARRDGKGRIAGWETHVFEFPCPPDDESFPEQRKSDLDKKQDSQKWKPPHLAETRSQSPEDGFSTMWRNLSLDCPDVENPLQLNTDLELNTEKLKEKECCAGAQLAIASSKNDLDEAAPEVRSPHLRIAHTAPQSGATPLPEGRELSSGASQIASNFNHIETTRSRRETAEDVYRSLGDLSGFELFWQWYRVQICGISGANEGSKAAAAKQWRSLERSNFHGIGREGFRAACKIYRDRAIAAKGIGTPHAERFLSGGEMGEPRWLVLHQERDAGGAESFLAGVCNEDDLYELRPMIARELERLGWRGIIPDEWRSQAGCEAQVVSDLRTAREAKSYLQWLRAQGREKSA